MLEMLADAMVVTVVLQYISLSNQHIHLKLTQR